MNDETPETGLYDAHFGLILTEHHLCKAGYQGTDKRRLRSRPRQHAR